MPSLATSQSAPPTHLQAWQSLVDRSISAWENIVTDDTDIRGENTPESMLRQCRTLDQVLAKRGDPFTIWFFQKRSAFEAQTRMKKWSRENLDDYILLPASPGYVLRRDCFFVSHFWRTAQDPDPDGAYLRLHQAELASQSWSYIWVDWTCMPQSPRSAPEEAYFYHGLLTMSGIIRNCGLTYFYPPFEPRLWILYEIAEYALTCDPGIESTPDVAPFLEHVGEMLRTGVQATLERHRYRCSDPDDRKFLMPWLELLVLLKRLQFDMDFIRRVMDHMTWHRHLATQIYLGVTLERFKGRLVVNGELHTFTPFPRWKDGKYSLEKPPKAQGPESKAEQLRLKELRSRHQVFFAVIALLIMFLAWMSRA